MHYIEIGQDLIDAIKGGADYEGQSEVDEITGYINQFGAICATIAAACKEIFEAIKAYFKF